MSKSENPLPRGQTPPQPPWEDDAKTRMDAGPWAPSPPQPPPPNTAAPEPELASADRDRQAAQKADAGPPPDVASGCAFFFFGFLGFFAMLGFFPAAASDNPFAGAAAAIVFVLCGIGMAMAEIISRLENK